MTRRSLVALGTAATIACSGDSGPGPSELYLEWRGVERGTFTAPLTARHCVETGLMELIAVRGDTGFGAAVYLAEAGTVAPGDYPVAPASSLTEPVPGAAAALRWLDAVSIVAFEGVSGTITLTGDTTALGGTLDIRMQSVERADSVRLTGRFDRLAVDRADTGCGSTMRRNKI